MGQWTRQPDPADTARLLAVLEKRRRAFRPGIDLWPRLAPAKAIAKLLNLGVNSRSWDVRRRRAREVIEALREAGHQVVAVDGTHGGYFLPVTAGHLTMYQEQRRRRGLQHLAAAGQVAHSPQAADAQGQLGLFAKDRR